MWKNVYVESDENMRKTTWQSMIVYFILTIPVLSMLYWSNIILRIFVRYF